MGIDSKLSGDGKTLTIKITERFDFSMQQDFRSAYKSSSDNISDITLDLSHADYMDSSALGMLLLLREHAGNEQASIQLTGCQPTIRQILAISNFEKLFDIS